MGLFNWWRAREAESEARAVAAKRIVELLEFDREDESDEWRKIVEKNVGAEKSSRDVNEAVSTIVNTRAEGAGWEILGSAWKGHIARDQQIMVAQARRFFRFDPNAQACIYGMLDYLMGKGVTITPKSKDPRIWKLWRQFWTNPANKMGIRQFEIFKRIFRDGETFLRFFNKDAAGVLTYQTIVRFMDPIDVQRGAAETGDDTDKTNQGITYDPDDAEKPLKYHMKDRINPGQEHVIDASEVLHIKFPVADMDQARGESAMQAVMDLFTHYKQWLKNRIILNKLRTAIFAVRTIKDTSGQSVAALTQTLPTSGRTSGGEVKKQNIKSGSLYTPPPGVDIEMRAANINASDVKEDGRNMILQMAAGTRLPEYMFGDASNANFASTMMAESPFVKHIHFLQAYFEETVWKPMFRKVVEAAVAAGKLTAPAEDDIFAEQGEASLNEDAKNGTGADAGDDKDDDADDKNGQDGQAITESETEIFFGCDIEWPEVIHRDPQEQTQALVLARNEGWISDKTASEKLGFDYPEEVRKQTMIMDEAERVGNPLLQHDQGTIAAHQEEQDGLDQQNKEMEMAGKGGSNGNGKGNGFNGKTKGKP